MSDPRISLRFLFSHPAHFISLGFGSGLSPVAPGTAGTLFAWASYLLISPWFGGFGFAVFLAACFVIGVIAIHKTGRDCGVTDHGSIVFDEIVPMWTVLALTPDSLVWQAVAFGFFRLFDITKPQPAKYFDSNVKNGVGVMMDDVVAGIYAIAAVQASIKLVSFI